MHLSYFCTISSFFVFLTSVLMASGLFPSLPRKCSGESMVPSWWKSASFSWSVSVVAEMPASGPRLGREPAASEGSGICPGIMSDPTTTTAVREERKREREERIYDLLLCHILKKQPTKIEFFTVKTDSLMEFIFTSINTARHLICWESLHGLV